LLNSDGNVFNIDRGQDYDLAEEKPTLHYIKTDEEDYILITIVWRTNKVGSTVSMWCYNVKTNSLFEINDGLEQIRYNVKENDQITEILIPQCNTNIEINIDDSYTGIYPQNGEVEFSRHVSYQIKDVDGDNIKEIITKRVIFTGAMNWLPIHNVYTTYKLCNDELCPIEFVFK
jgi:hypothetical protein